MSSGFPPQNRAAVSAEALWYVRSTQCCPLRALKNLLRLEVDLASLFWGSLFWSTETAISFAASEALRLLAPCRMSDSARARSTTTGDGRTGPLPVKTDELKVSLLRSLSYDTVAAEGESSSSFAGSDTVSLPLAAPFCVSTGPSSTARSPSSIPSPTGMELMVIGARESDLSIAASPDSCHTALARAWKTSSTLVSFPPITRVRHKFSRGIQMLT
mmetsp:Transcript_2426/g.7007  ORF Transcript_2426/g.7007 Transcript_2426/m.7007 type:complete len:216 (-) Transcript_2426:1140-1787(-)